MNKNNKKRTKIAIFIVLTRFDKKNTFYGHFMSFYDVYFHFMLFYDVYFHFMLFYDVYDVIMNV